MQAYSWKRSLIDKTNRSRPTRVAVGIIRDKKNRVLISRRKDNVYLGGRWEFPGGKLKQGETPVHALRRELNEELGIKLAEAEFLLDFTYSYDRFDVRLFVFAAGSFQNEIIAREGQVIKWHDIAGLPKLELLAGNTPIIRVLELPRLYMITPSGKTNRELAGLISYAKQHFDISLVRLRDKNISYLEYEKKARFLLDGFPEIKFLLDWADMAKSLNVAGVHLTGKMLSGATCRPVGDDMLVGVSCHSASDLVKGHKIQADFAVLSPVNKTVTHPGQAGMGWKNFKALAKTACFPVYALGGVSPGDAAVARNNGAYGVAGIRGFGV